MKITSLYWWSNCDYKTYQKYGGHTRGPNVRFPHQPPASCTSGLLSLLGPDLSWIEQTEHQRTCQEGVGVVLHLKSYRESTREYIYLIFLSSYILCLSAKIYNRF